MALVSGFFHRVSCFQDSSTLQQESFLFMAEYYSMQWIKLLFYYWLETYLKHNFLSVKLRPSWAVDTSCSMKTINYAFRLGPFSYFEVSNSAFPSSSSNIFTSSALKPPIHRAENVKGPSSYRCLGAHAVSLAGDKHWEEQKKIRSDGAGLEEWTSQWGRERHKMRHAPRRTLVPRKEQLLCRGIS